MSESNGKKARFAPGSANDNTDSYEYHWFVTNARSWVTSDSLLVALARLTTFMTKPRERDEMPVSVWRVPGRDKETYYDVTFYTPQIEGAVFVGTSMPNEHWLMTENGPVKLEDGVS